VSLRYRVFKYRLITTVSLVAMTIYAPPTLRELGAATYAAGKYLGAVK
jgi:hypothetical protein